jgi:hypothetical protein
VVEQLLCEIADLKQQLHEQKVSAALRDSAMQGDMQAMRGDLQAMAAAVQTIAAAAQAAPQPAMQAAPQPAVQAAPQQAKQAVPQPAVPAAPMQQAAPKQAAPEQQAGAAGARGAKQSYAATAARAAPKGRATGLPARYLQRLREPELRRTFTVRTPAVTSSGSASAAVRGVLASIGLEPASILVVDATFIGPRPAGPGGAARILFVVGSADQADAIVSARCRLKGSGCTIFEVLSDREQAQHALLWPVYEAALADGQKPQFRRARLIVDGVHVPVPMPAR